MQKRKINRILNDLNDLKDSKNDNSYWKEYDFNSKITFYFIEHECTWDEAVEAVTKSYKFNPDEYVGISDVSDLIDDEVVSEIIDVYDE